MISDKNLFNRQTIALFEGKGWEHWVRYDGRTKRKLDIVVVGGENVDAD